jgi:hypothetical protein
VPVFAGWVGSPSQAVRSALVARQATGDRGRMTTKSRAPAAGADVPRTAGFADGPVLRGRPLVRAWFRVVTVAETAGFAVPACVGALTADVGAAVVVPSLLAAGAVEGAVLGWGQATVLRRALPGLSRRRWIGATAGAAAFAYLLGLIPSMFGTSVFRWPVVFVVVAAVLLSGGLLSSIGSAQWLILRGHVGHAGRWIVATAVAWVVGLGVFLLFAMPLWRPGQPVVWTATIGVGGGVLMAGTTSAVTGFALRRLVGHPSG